MTPLRPLHDPPYDPPNDPPTTPPYDSPTTPLQPSRSPPPPEQGTKKHVDHAGRLSDGRQIPQNLQIKDLPSTYNKGIATVIKHKYTGFSAVAI